MKKQILSCILAASMILTPVSVFADETDDRIAEIESQIAELQAELKELKKDKLPEFTYEADGYKFEYTGNALSENSSGEECVAVYFTFTNNSKDSVSPEYSLPIMVFQNGISIDQYSGWDSEDKAVKTASKEVRPDTTVDIGLLYKIEDYSDVTMEFSSFTGETETSEFTFSITQP